MNYKLLHDILNVIYQTDRNKNTMNADRTFISIDLGVTFTHVDRILKRCLDNNIVLYRQNNNVKYYYLTDKGKELLDALHIVFQLFN